jgi:serine/threonine protein kinase
LSHVVGSNKENSGIIDLASFDYLKDLGEGQFGTVKLIRDKALGRLYALKQISKSSIKK